MRAAKLRADPICEQPGCRALATEVDHIQGVGDGGERYDWTNLQSLCTPCHERKTLAEAQAARRKTAGHRG